MKIALADQIKSVEREIAMRKAVYPKRVAAKAMSQVKADYEIAAMKATLQSLQILQTYADPNNWRFAHDENNAPIWICNQGPEPALEASNGIGTE